MVANILRANCVVKQNAKYRCIYLYFKWPARTYIYYTKKPIHLLTVIITVRQREIDKKFLGMNEEKKIPNRRQSGRELYTFTDRAQSG
jgi:hypothetical protein